MPLYVDACVLAKRYLPEGTSSQTVKMILGRSSKMGGLFASSFCEPEVVSAFAKYVRERSIPEQRRQALALHPAIVALFQKEFTGGAFGVVEATALLFRQAAELLRDHPDWNIGAGDALHLATALSIRFHSPEAAFPLVFVTADRGLAAAAKASGFPVFNPDFQPFSALEVLIRPSSAS